MLEKTSAETMLRPAAGAVFALLDGRSVLFTETGQKIYELDQVGHLIWCKLAQGASLVHQELGQLGNGPASVVGFKPFPHELQWRLSTGTIQTGACRFACNPRSPPFSNF